MAKGIAFYKDYIKIESLKNRYETQLFTERFNNLFDASNRQHVNEGIRLNSNDFKVLILIFIFLAIHLNYLFVHDKKKLIKLGIRRYT